jgi:hypothetical protein
MYWNRSAVDIALAWQTEIESKMEIGASALLLGGAPASLIPSIATLAALKYSADQRNDVATPLLIAGGSSALWLGLLLPPLPSGNELSAPAPTIVYGGADEATYLATAALSNTVAFDSTPTQRSSSTSATKAGTAQEMGGQFAPRLQAGAATAWEMLPFVEVGEQPTPALPAAPIIIDPTGDWIAWGVMLLAFCLVLSALLI